MSQGKLGKWDREASQAHSLTFTCRKRFLFWVCEGIAKSHLHWGGGLILRCCDAWVRICSLRWLLTGFLSHSHILVASPGVRHAYITFQTVVWAGTVGYAYVCSLLYKMNHCFRRKGSLKIKRHCLEFETSEFVKGLY